MIIDDMNGLMSNSPLSNFGDCRDLTNRTQVDPQTIIGPRLLVLVLSGQSMWANSSNAEPYVPWTGGVYEFNQWNAGVYRSTGTSCLGCDSYNPGGAPRISIVPYLADLIVANHKADRVLICNICVCGTSSVFWRQDGPGQQRRASLMQRLTLAGLPGPNYWIHIQGQGDIPLGTSQGDYVTNGISGIAGLRAVGYQGAYIIGQGCHWTGWSDTHPSIAAGIVNAQLQLTMGLGGIRGPNDDEFDDTYRVDNVHWNDNGRYWTVQRWLPACPTFP